MKLATLATGLGLVASSALADGELYIYNWTDYTSPELIEKFEAETGITVTMDTYDSNDTLLAKLKSGASGYDIVVPSHNYVPIFVAEELFQKINAQDLEGYSNIADGFRNPPWDSANEYTVPWQWGSTSFTVNTDVFGGDIDTYETLFRPPEELRGQIGMFKAPSDVVDMALIYLGYGVCSESKDEMREVLELLEEQKPHVKVYNSDGILERLTSGDAALHQNWNGYSIRARTADPALKYAFPKEGVLTWADNIAVPVGAQNYDNAIKFIEFILQPENIAIQSNFAGYSNGISGSAEFLNEEMATAPELSPPDGTPMVFSETCSENATELQNKVWTTLLQ
ncbi:ABC transporter substrate-binding protein [Ruegeria arenilitoris]|uniref:ABC transporter substrate-binding protein n=1 Tax=Ruegeria arenilitoris TaxID=1173585 RepID=UPI00147E0E30|nr:extracellular solute-binding protein [Ruegeria arenilitoris]